MNPTIKIYLDTETRSEVPIKRGTKAYVNGEYFSVIMVQFAIDDGEVHVWEPADEPMPQALQEAIDTEGRMFVMHNSTFDRNALNQSGLLGFDIKPEDIIDTMVQALAHGYPGGLDSLSQVFGLPEDTAKDKRGKRLIQMFCVPDRSSKQVAFHTKQTKPQDWEAFREYGIRDIMSMRELHKKLPSHNYPNKEHGLWCIDQRINDRGIPVDVEFAEAAVSTAVIERHRLCQATQDMTAGEVQAATQRDKLIKHMSEAFGIQMADLRTKTLDSAIYDESLPPEMRELLRIRQMSSMNSSSKYNRILEQQVNGRVCYTMQMYGASRTGRDAGRGLQPQNLRRPTSWKGVKADSIEDAIEADIEAIKSGAGNLFIDNVMMTLSDCVRSVIQAPEGKKLVVADLSNIEGRGLVYLSDEEWKLDYFRKFDAGEIRFDNYVMAYAKSMNVPPETVKKDGRQIGKVQELGLGYGGGVLAFLTFADVYRLDLAELANAVWDTGDFNELEDCRAKYDWAKQSGFHGGLPEMQFAACEYLKRLWREAHPKTVQFWSDLEDAFRFCIANSNETVTVGKLKFRRQGRYLYIKLPSGRLLTYLDPKIDKEGNCSFMGVNQFTKKWQRIKTYSGKLSENVTSAFARDVLFYRMPDIEDAGYGIIIRVHDELVCEVPDSPEYSADKLANMMATPHEWCKDLPLAAAGFEAKRYRKD